MRGPTAREVVVVAVGSCAVVTLARRMLDRMERWARLHARVDGVTAVSAEYLGLTPYPAPWTDSSWDQPGWYGERPATSFRVNGMRFVGPREWVDQIRAQHGADDPEAN